MVVDDSLAHVHRLVEYLDLVFIAEGGVYFLFYNGSHTISQLVGQRIQKCELGILLFLREGTHRN